MENSLIIKRCHNIINESLKIIDENIRKSSHSFMVYRKKRAEGLLMFRQAVKDYINDNFYGKDYEKDFTPIIERNFDFLKENYNVFSKEIEKEITESLYARIFSEKKLEFLFELAGIKNNTPIICENCDAGMIVDLSEVVNPVYECSWLTDFEKKIFDLNDQPNCSNELQAIDDYFVMMDSRRYYDRTKMKHGWHQLKEDELWHRVEEIGETGTVIEILSSYTMTDPSWFEFRKNTLMSGKLFAVVELSSEKWEITDYIALIFKGVSHEEIMMMTSEGISFNEKKESIEWPYILNPSTRIVLSNNPNLTLLQDVAKNLTRIKDQIVIDTKIGEVSFSQLDNEFPLHPIELYFRTLNIGDDKSCVFWTGDKDIVIIAEKGGVIFTGYIKDIYNQYISLKGFDNCYYCVLGIDPNGSVIAQYIAQLLLSDKVNIKEHIARWNVGTFGENLQNLYIIKENLRQQQDFIAKNTYLRYQRDTESLESKNDDYEKLVRDRKHHLSHKFSDVKWGWKLIKDYLEGLDNEPFDKNSILSSRKPISIGELMENLSKALANSIMEINMIADKDRDYGDAVTLNLQTEIENYFNRRQALHHDLKIIGEKVSLTPDNESYFNIKFPPKGLDITLTNIFDNIIRHGFKGEDYKKNKTIKIGMEIKDTYVEVKISNNGRMLREENILTNDKSIKHSDGHFSEGRGLKQIKEIMERYEGSLQLIPVDDGDFKTAYLLNFKRYLTNEKRD